MRLLTVTVVFGIFSCVTCFNLDAVSKTREADGEVGCWQCSSDEDAECATLNKGTHHMLPCQTGEHCYTKEIITFQRFDDKTDTTFKMERGCSEVYLASVAEMLEDGAREIHATNCFVSGCNDQAPEYSY